MCLRRDGRRATLPAMDRTPPEATGEWEPLPSDATDLFSRLRERAGGRVCVRVRVGVEAGCRVAVPAASCAVQGLLRVEPVVDRFSVLVEGWGAGGFAWLARRLGRGHAQRAPDYWQGAVEYHAEGRPALVLYFTAPADGLEILVFRPRTGLDPLEPAAT